MRQFLGRLLAAALMLFALFAAQLAFAGTRTVGETAPGTNYIEIVCMDPLTGIHYSCAGTGPAANLATSQISVASTATLVISARAGRSLLSVENGGTTDVWCGPTAGVTTSTGHLLPGIKGASLNLAYSAAMYCIVTSASATVTVAETY